MIIEILMEAIQKRLYIIKAGSRWDARHSQALFNSISLFRVQHERDAIKMSSVERTGR